jgi:hypothetical protein
VPTEDTGGAAMSALQYMLMQCVGNQILLFQAWPTGWNVDCKLNAPNNTSVRVVVQGGTITKSAVIPSSRVGNVVIGGGITGGVSGGTEGPYDGTPAAIPGTVQAENYDTGGQGLAYNVTSINGTDNAYRSDGVDLEVTSDTGGGVDLGWASGGQWFKYTVNVATAGTYTVSFRVAAPTAVTDGFHLSSSSGANLSGNVNVPATGGYQTWTTVTASVTLPAGQQTLTLNQDNGGWNINYATFPALNEGPYGGTAAAIPGTVQAENYDTGGQGAGYSVNSVNGTDNGYRSDGVDLEVTSDTGGGVDLGWTSGTQWFKYTVNVATAGTYTVSFRVASPTAVTDGFHLANSSGANLSGNVNVPATGGFQTWTTVTATVTLPSGQQTLTLNQDNGGWNINYMGFASSGSTTLLPTQNATVRDGTNANTNFNGATTLRVKNDVVNNNRHVYLTFDTSSMGSVSSAVINLYVVGTGSSATRTITVYEEPTTSWLESTITWNNAPAAGTQIGSFSVSTTTGIYYNFDVTSYVQAQRSAGNKVVSFELINNTTDVNGLVDFASREATTGQPGLTCAP